MTSYERVKAALEHKEPDKIPFDLGGTLVSGINIKALSELKRYLEKSLLYGVEVAIINLLCLLEARRKFVTKQEEELTIWHRKEDLYSLRFMLFKMVFHPKILWRGGKSCRNMALINRVLKLLHEE